MKYHHWIAFGVGLAVGYFVVPMVIGAVRGASSKG